MRFVFSAIAVLLLSGSARAQSFEDGAAAYLDGNVARALEAWLPLAETGNRDAQFNVGILHAQGLGVPVDRDAALVWLGRAAEQGDIIAAYNLGLMLSDCTAASHDDARAVEWYEMAAARDHPGATENLALMLANGQGVERDPGRAVKLSTVSEELECLLDDRSQNHRPRLVPLDL